MNKQDISTLFTRAIKKNFLDYLFTLLRIQGCDTYDIDPLISLEKEIYTLDIENIFNNQHIWFLLANIYNVSIGNKYNLSIFNNYDKLNSFYVMTRNIITDQVILGKLTEITSSVEKLRVFILNFLDVYKQSLLLCKTYPKFHKMPGFEVLEIITNDTGLTGINVHFSNGSCASYLRKKDGVDCRNIIFDPSGYNFMIGCIDDLKEEWRVNGKRLSSIGLQNRYNKKGEWKPLFYPGKGVVTTDYEKEARAFSSDERIQGLYFYILCTSCWVIEFVAIMRVKLPSKTTQFTENIILDRLDPETEFSADNEYIYDGTYLLNNTDEKSIFDALEIIDTGLKLISFSFDSPVKWRLKYSLHDHTQGCASPTDNDIEYLNKIATSINQKEMHIYSAAIDWYCLGINNNNPINAFICFHIAIEGLAVNLSKNKLSSSSYFGISNNNNDNIKNKELFDEYYRQYYSHNLDKLISKAYFEIVVSIKNQLAVSLKAVFGSTSPYIKEYFEGPHCLWKLRGDIVHTNKPLDYKELILISNKSQLIKEIAKEFISRVILKTSPNEEVIDWSRKFTLSMATTTPHGTLITNNMKIIPNEDWRIKKEWI